MYLYRLTREKYAADLSGEGAKLFGGRWNSVGAPMLYTSTHRSLAVLELLVNLPINLMPKDMVIITLQLKLEEIPNLENLPQNWREMPVPRITQQLGDHWLKQNQLGIRVSSTVIQEENNILLNPKHSDFSKAVNIIDQSPFRFDKRLFNKINP